MSSYTIEWGWKKIADERFLPLVNNQERFLLLSSDEDTRDFVVKKILYRCLLEQKFNYLLIGETESEQYELVMDIIGTLHLEFLFEADPRRKEIRCINGNRIVGFQPEQLNGIKKIKFPCGAWYEKPSIRAIEGVTGLIKDEGVSYRQEIITCPLNDRENINGLQAYLMEKHQYSFKSF
jgi:hypothetical protein